MTSPVPQSALLLYAAVKQALLYAATAVAADEKQDYAAAHANYRQAAAILRNEAKNAPPEDQPLFHDRILVYTRRAELIEIMNPFLKKDDVVSEASASAEFREEPLSSDPFPEDVPEVPAHRPFWLMRTLLKTMTTGAFLAPRLYVHRGVWFQQGVKLEQCNIKLGACLPMLEGLQLLGRCALSDVSTIAAELETFTDKLFVIQNTFAQSFSIIQKAHVDEKVLKRMKKTLEKGAVAMSNPEKHDDATNYVQALMSIFKEAQFLEAWHKHFALAKNQQILALLSAVSEYFTNVLCALVLADLNVLLDRYLRRSLTQLMRGSA